MPEGIFLEMLLTRLKRLLGLTEDAQDEMLLGILETVYARLCVRLGVEAIPEELLYLVEEAAVIRFNRIGSEGMASHTVEGEAVSFSGDEFASFSDDIQAWQLAKTEPKKGRVRFL